MLTLILKLLRLGGSHTVSEYNVWLELILYVLFGVKRVLGLHAMPAATEMDSRVQRQSGLFNCFPT